MLKTRVATALVLLIVVLFLAFTLSPFYWALATLAACVVAGWEWARLAGSRFTLLYALLTAICGITILVIEEQPIAGWSPGYLAAILFWTLLAPLWLAGKWQVRNTLLLALTGWVVLLPAWLAIVQLQALDPLLLLWVMSIIWIADTAAFMSGRQFGRHKLAPSISPNKTWEGVAGAAIAVALYAGLGTLFGVDRYIMARSAPQVTHASTLFLGLSFVIAGLGIVGDLFESWIKRTAHAKDSSTLLPGHGGVLDRIDGLTPTLPLFAFLVAMNG
jgi:phosphatidate cytidylyltransferase